MMHLGKMWMPNVKLDVQGQGDQKMHFGSTCPGGVLELGRLPMSVSRYVGCMHRIEQHSNRNRWMVPPGIKV